MRSPGEFFRLPSTKLGRVSAVTFLVAIVVIALGSTVFESMSPSVGQINIGPAIGALLLLVALGAGALALIRDRERSWAVWVSTVLPAIVLGFEVLSLLIPGA